MTEGESMPDIPKFVAALGTRVPMLAIRLGVSYLRLKGRANRASKAFVSELEAPDGTRLVFPMVQLIAR